MNKPIFLPLLDNGAGDIKANFLLAYASAFAGRQVHVMRASDSHADRGMNAIANAFLKSDCDVWINIDCDIIFTANDISRLLSHDLPLVYGIYPKKEDVCAPCLCTLTNEQPEPDANGLVEVRRCGRGFMLVKRELLEAMKEDNGGPALRYHNHGEVQWNFFESGPITGEFSTQGEGNDAGGFQLREWVSEDWMFCDRARSLGYKVYADSRIVLGHEGSKVYRFAAGQVAKVDAPTSWRDIHGWFDFQDVYRQIVNEIPDGGRFVEVGCWLGRSIAAFHEFAKEAGKRIELHVVDTFEGEPSNGEHAAILQQHGGNVRKAFEENMRAAGVNGELTVHAMDSATAGVNFENNSCDAVFIDAAHDYESVIEDIAAWMCCVKPGGILAGHDYRDYPEVRKAVNDLLGEKNVEVVANTWIYRVK